MAKLRRIQYAGPMSAASATEQVPLGQVEAMPAITPFNVLQNRPFPPASGQIPAAQVGGVTNRPEIAAPQPQTGGQLRRIIPEQAFTNTQELRPWNMAQAIPGASRAQQVAVGAMQPLTISDEEMAAMLKQADPEIIVDRNRETGALTIYSPTSQKSFVINEPGVSWNDALNFVSTIAAAIPAGRATTMAGRAAAEAAIQSGIETGQRQLGGQFNIQEPLLAGAFSAGTDLVTLYNQARRARSVQSAAEEAGATPATGQVAGQIARTVSTVSQPSAAGAGRVARGQAPSQAAQSFEQIVNADPRVVQAAQQLGLSEVLPMRVFSRNPQYIQVEQALSNMPGSVMAEPDKAARLALAGKADEFITQFRGTRDLGELDSRIVENFNTTLDELRVQSDDIYRQINDAVPIRRRVQANDVRAYLVNKARDLGGVSKLNPLEQKVLRESRANQGITYARLDDLRQEVGEKYGNALRGNSFGDTTTYSLKGLYNALTEAQGNAIESIASSETRGLWDAGKALVNQRKELEAQAEKLLGREFSRSIAPQISGAIRGLLDGNIRQFEQVLNRIPEQYRSETIVSAMDKLFTSGARNEPSLNMGGFGATWEKLSRSPTAKQALISKMPEGAEAFLDNLAIISKQWAAATATVPKTGIVEAMGKFGSDNGFIAKVLPMIPVAGNRIAGVFSYAGPDVTQAAANLMANPDFRRVVVRGSQGQNTQQAQAAVMRSPAFQAWTETLPSNVRNRVLSVGLTDYLFEENR